MPTPCYNDAYSVGTPEWALWEKGWLKHHETTFSHPSWTFLFGKQKNFLFFLVGYTVDASYRGGPGNLGLALAISSPGQLSIEFLNVGGWLTSGDLAMDSCAQFLAVAEHRLIPSRARSVCHRHP